MGSYGITAEILIQVRISLQQQLEQMSRKSNKHAYYTKHIPTKTQIYSYRNAVYQGQLSQTNGKRTGRGILYLPDTHHFIATNQFASNKLNGYSFVYHKHAKYMFGEWRNNKPDGILVIRIDEMLLIAQFVQGKMPEAKKFLVILQKINLGLILQLKSSGKLEVLAKEDVLTCADIQKMISECQFKLDQRSIHHSLIKFLNKSMSSGKKEQPKLRVINNSFYRYGYDIGLAVLFDDQYRLLSVGLHNKNVLTSLGVKFHGPNLANRVQEGVFDGYNTFTYDLKSKPEHKISELYRKFHLSELNFKNQVYKDPSDHYFKYIQDLLNDQAIISFFRRQELSQSRKMVASLSQSKEIQSQFQSKKQHSLQKLHVGSISLQNFRKTPVQIQNDKFSQNIPNPYKYDPRQNSRETDTIEFQSLNIKQKLEVLKKQIYQNVNHKVQLEQNKQNSMKKAGIITKSAVKIVHKGTDYRQAQLPIETKKFRIEQYKPKREEIVIEDQLVNNEETQIIPNLQQKIDVIIKNDPSLKSLPSQSRSKKRIFEQYSNVKRDYSPQTQVSPFKSRMKSRIFQKAPSRSREERSRSKSPNRIFGASKTPEKRQTGKFYLSKNTNEPSLKQLQKSQSSSQLKMFPVTMERTKVDKLGLRQISKQYKEQRQQSRNKPKRNIQQQQNLKLQKNISQDQFSKKSNHIYKNNMKSEYGNYIYEPINLSKQPANAPYVQKKGLLSKTASNATLKHNPSQTTIHRQMSKKSIEDSSPNKKEKMGAYMNGQSFGLKEAQRLSDFKRRVNYF